MTFYLSFTNVLVGPDPQGIELLKWILRYRSYFPYLWRITIHTGNLPKWRAMIRLLKGSGLVVRRIVPTDRIYPRMSNDQRKVIAYTRAE